MTETASIGEDLAQTFRKEFGTGASRYDERFLGLLSGALVLKPTQIPLNRLGTQRHSGGIDHESVTVGDFAPRRPAGGRILRIRCGLLAWPFARIDRRLLLLLQVTLMRRIPVVPPG